IASSRESCGLSRRRTTSSRRARERSKSGFLPASGFFGTGEFTREPCLLCSGSCGHERQSSVIGVEATSEHSKARARKDTIALWCDHDSISDCARIAEYNLTGSLSSSRVKVPALTLKCVY